MPGRPRKPLAVAKLDGSVKTHKKRYAGRSEPPSTGPIGKAPAFFTQSQKVAWAAFVGELPWLQRADRGLLEAASIVRTRLQEESGNVALIREMRLLANALGASPTSRTSVKIPSSPDRGTDFDFLN